MCLGVNEMRTVESGRSPAPIGICSVTFRALDAGEVARRTAEAGLRLVEWGSDRHAPPDDPGALLRVRDRTAELGLTTCSYGSYFEAGSHDWRDFTAIADAAAMLGTDRVRVWAGTRGSAQTGARERGTVVDTLRRVAGIAADRGLGIALEYHGGSLTDTPESTLRLLDEIGLANVSTYWQAPLGMAEDEALSGLDRLAERVSAVHVFSWWPDTTRRPLSARESLWTRAFGLLRARGLAPDILLEFVPDDDPDVLPGEAATLARFVGAPR
jgi:3-dehydroshikimate dehydratase